MDKKEEKLIKEQIKAYKERIKSTDKKEVKEMFSRKVENLSLQLEESVGTKEKSKDKESDSPKEKEPLKNINEKIFDEGKKFFGLVWQQKGDNGYYCGDLKFAENKTEAIAKINSDNDLLKKFLEGIDGV